MVWFSVHFYYYLAFPSNRLGILFLFMACLAHLVFSAFLVLYTTLLSVGAFCIAAAWDSISIFFIDLDTRLIIAYRTLKEMIIPTIYRRLHGSSGSDWLLLATEEGIDKKMRYMTMNGYEYMYI